MALKSPKAKGSSGELEVCRLLTQWAADVGVCLTLERNLLQTREGGADVSGVPGMEVEVKRQENLNIPAAWRQVCAAAARTGNHPMLIHRQNRRPWRVRTLVRAALQVGTAWDLVPLVADLELEQAEKWFKSYIKLNAGVEHGS